MPSLQITHTAFQSTSPLRGSTFQNCWKLRRRSSFQSTSPLRGSTPRQLRHEAMFLVSIHEPLAGLDRRRRWNNCPAHGFNPRAPCGARRADGRRCRPCLTFQSTSPLRGSTQSYRRACGLKGGFNPRAPCGARHRQKQPRRRHQRFNPRAPCGARPSGIPSEIIWRWFQSTSPLRGSTSTYTPRGWSVQFQSTSPLRGSTSRESFPAAFHPVSIHEPLAGLDPNDNALALHETEFQSTSPLRGSTLLSTSCAASFSCFNPRAPCGARPRPRITWQTTEQVSIHEPLAGLDRPPCPWSGDSNFRFNPRAPCGARLCRPQTQGHTARVSIHEPLAGLDDPHAIGVAADFLVSIHEPLAGLDKMADD